MWRSPIRGAATVFIRGIPLGTASRERLGSLRSPRPFCAHCHCGMCRRAHGAPLVTWIGFLASQFRIVEGEAHLRRYASSEQATRSFCEKCGSMMLFESSHWAGEVHVARALIPGEVDRLPQAHCFFSDKAKWLTVADELPRLGGPSGLEKL